MVTTTAAPQSTAVKTTHTYVWICFFRFQSGWPKEFLGIICLVKIAGVPFSSAGNIQPAAQSETAKFNFRPTNIGSFIFYKLNYFLRVSQKKADAPVQWILPNPLICRAANTPLPGVVLCLVADPRECPHIGVFGGINCCLSPRREEIIARTRPAMRARAS
jgi:hypothetical protein